MSNSPNYIAYQDLPEEIRTRFEAIVQTMSDDVMNRIKWYANEAWKLVVEMRQANQREAKLLMVIVPRPLEVIAAEIYNVGFEEMPADVRKAYNLLYPNHSVIGKVG